MDFECHNVECHSILKLSNISEKFISTVSFHSIQFLFCFSAFFFLFENKKKLSHIMCHWIVVKVHNSFYKYRNLTLNYLRSTMLHPFSFKMENILRPNWIPAGLKHHHKHTHARTHIHVDLVKSVYKRNPYRIYTSIIKKSSTHTIRKFNRNSMAETNWISNKVLI